MKFTRILLLSVALVTVSAAHSATVNKNTPHSFSPYNVLPVHGLIPTNTAPEINLEILKAQQEAFETQRNAYEKAIAEQQKLQAEAFAIQQKSMIEQTQHMHEQYEAALKAQRAAQNQTIQRSRKIAAKQAKQIRKYFEAAIQAQQKAAADYQKYSPSPVPFPAHPMNAIVPSIEKLQAQQKAVTEHLEQLRLRHGGAMIAHFKAREEQRKLMLDRLTAMNKPAK